MPGDSRSSAGLGARAREVPRSVAAAVGRIPAGLSRAWRLLGPEQRATAVGSVLLAVSTLGPFSWVEAAELTVAAGVLYLLKKRADRAAFHLPFGDGIVIAVGGAWTAVLILIRLPSRSLGQGLLALACAAVLVGAGLRERAKRPADDLPDWEFPTREAPTERL
jgi:hypothetical protein